MEGKLFLGQYLIWVMILLGQLHGHTSCIEKERMALFEIKKYLLSITIEEESESVLTTWTNDTDSDCCQWDGVECNRTSGRVTELAIDIPYLKDSYLLNLSLLHPFEEVRSLNLTQVAFSGLFDDVEGYKSLGRLRNLEILDLSNNRFDNRIFPFLNAATSLRALFLQVNYMDGPFPAECYKSLRRLRNLEILDLSFSHFNNSIFPFLTAAKSLTTLFLRSNNMDGPLPAEELKYLTNLELLDLSGNRFNGSIQVQELSTLRKLKALDLSSNEFSASMGMQGICELKSIQELDISRNKLVGQFPLCLTSLSGLRVLDLSTNQLTGDVPSALSNLESLEYLSLIDNNFEGLFSVGSLANLSNLRVFKLGSRSKSFQVDSESSWEPKFRLSVIALPSCNLENIPQFLIYQKDLSHIDLSDNKISGNFPHWLLANNTKLKVFFLKNNSFTSFELPKSVSKLLFLDVSVNEFNHLPENIGWILPQLVFMNISSNRFQGNLPSSLGNMERILYMDISHNSFHGNLPRSLVMGCYSMRILTLSHNKLSGEVFPESVNFTYMRELSMDNNLFTGNIGQGMRSLEYLQFLDISNNSLTGVIPSWIGELTSLTTLLLSKNSLEGEIPVSLFNLTYLELLDLSANILSEGIPTHINSRRPVILLFQDNNLSGVIAETLLTNVSILDLRNNRLSGNIPEFTNTRNTHTLLLRGNKLTGSIPRQLCGLKNIQLLDLSRNMLKGSIPPCLSDTSFGLGKEDTSYEYEYGYYSIISETGRMSFSGLPLQEIIGISESHSIHFNSRILLDPFMMVYRSITQMKIQFATKHRYDAYIGENLKLLFGMDLSENELNGEIPIELGGLLEVQALNLSHNKLSGVIPESFSGLKNLESLDLSFNRLQGRIPPQLTEMSSLAVFNVSFNNLSGVIPQGKQFNTFDTQSYLGNSLLCGQPTNMSCDNNNNFQEPDNEVEAEESTIDMISFYWSFVAAYVTILLGVLASLSFDSPWSRFWFYVIDAFIHKAMNLLW